MPASSAVRRSLISDLPVIYVIMRRHNLKISLVLRSCMRAGIGSGGKIVWYCVPQYTADDFPTMYSGCYNSFCQPSFTLLLLSQHINP